MIITYSISIPPVRLRYRVVADDASLVRLVASRTKDLHCVRSAPLR
jgi:hypothetical protein